MTKKINIGGIAIREGVSRNGVLYSKEELLKFAPTLESRPILKDHNSTCDSTIGLVTASESTDSGETVSYSGWVKDDSSKIVEKIEDGRIKEVSIGAIVGKLVKESEDSEVMIAKDMYGMEISTTPTPGVSGTSIKQSFKIDEKTGKQIQLNTIVEDFNTSSNPEIEEDILDITKEDSKKEETKSQSSEYSDKELNYRRLINMTEGKEDVTESSVTQEEFDALKTEFKALKEERFTELASKYSKMCEKLKITEKKGLSFDALKVITESLEEVDEQPKEEAKEEEVAEETEESPKDAESEEPEAKEDAKEDAEEAKESEDNEPDTKSEVSSEEKKESLDSKYTIESADKVGMSFYKH